MPGLVPTLLTFFAGIACAGIGGETFLRGAVGLARLLRIPPVLIGMTVAAFATSSPELAVSISASAAGQPAIALGDALGSNVVNIGLILALALVFAPIEVPQGSLRRDLIPAVMAPLLTALLLADGRLGRFNALLLVGLFGTWMAATVRFGLRERQKNPAPEESPPHAASTGLRVTGGLLLLFLAGRLIVASGKAFGVLLGLDAFVVGATLVAVGTSIPELATTVIARIRGHEDIALGTVLGSNLFNGLFILPVAGLICPPEVHFREVALALAAGLAVILLVLPGRSGILPRRRGWFLLLLFSLYVAAVINIRS